MKKRRIALSCSIRITCIITWITSKHKGGFYYLNCLHSFRTKKLKSHEKVCKIKDLCGFSMHEVR